MLGVLGIFDDIEPVIDNLMGLCKSDGRIYIYSGIINDDPVDVIMRAKRVDIPAQWQHYEPGWNIISKHTLRKIFGRYPEIKEITFHDFDIEIDINKTDDPLRSWTFMLGNGKRGTMNGTRILQRPRLMIVSL